jgi:quercetin dioxygenase-like cupin family protein
MLTLAQHPQGFETEPGNRIVYDVARDEAHFGAARVEGHALVWELTGDPGPGDWVLRCDRVDFPPGSVAYRHTHPGPGIRVLLRGRIRIETAGEAREYGPFESWHESGPEPVLAVASETEETGFVRVMLLPADWAGRRTIRYVDAADEERPKLQRATILLEHPVER